MRVLIAVLCTVLTINVWASDAKTEKAKELVKTMKITKNIDNTFKQITKFSEQMIDAQKLTPKQAEQAKKLSREAMEASFSRMRGIDWETIVARIYAKVFTEQELQELVDFYKSPIGVKVLDKQPELMRETMKVMQGEMVKIMPAIQQDIKKSIEAAKASE